MTALRDGIVTLGVVLFMMTVAIPAAAQSPNCPGADPDDPGSDDDALQWCLDKYMYHVLRWLGPLGGWIFRRGMYKKYYA